MRIEADPAYHHLSQIQRNQVESLNGAQAAAAHETVERHTVQGGQDQVILSSQAQELQRLHQAVEELPDVSAKVEAIREAVEAGTYEIPEDPLSERLMGIL